jgi:hypothetical protein
MVFHAYDDTWNIVCAHSTLCARIRKVEMIARRLTGLIWGEVSIQGGALEVVAGDDTLANQIDRRRVQFGVKHLIERIPGVDEPAVDIPFTDAAQIVESWSSIIENRYALFCPSPQPVSASIHLAMRWEKKEKADRVMA